VDGEDHRGGLVGQQADGADDADVNAGELHRGAFLQTRGVL
jgi:hypothetical protein